METVLICTWIVLYMVNGYGYPNRAVMAYRFQNLAILI